MKTRNMISDRRAIEVIEEMKEEGTLVIDVLAAGPNARVSVGEGRGIWHRFDRIPTVRELQSIVPQAYAVDLEA